MRQNKHYAARQTPPNLLANLIPRERCYEQHSASVEGVQMAISVGEENFEFAVQCGRGQGKVQQMWLRCGQRTQIFCPRHLHSRPVFSSLGLECLRSRLGLEGFRSRALSLETLHEVIYLCSRYKK